MDETLRTSVWSVLDITPTKDRADIKRAYAAKLKMLDRERDVGAFQALRAAYEAAMAWAQSADRTGPVDDGGVQFDVGEMPNAVEARQDVAGASAQVPSASGAPDARMSDADIAEAVVGILDACVRIDHSDALMAYLGELPALQRLDEVDRIGRALAIAVQEHEDIRWPMLAALSERFDWAAIPAASGATPDEVESIQAFIRRRHLRELIAHRALPRDLQTHYDDLMTHLKPPFGFWRALRIASLLLRDLRQSVAAVRAGFGPESELVVGRDAEAFVDAVYGRDAPWPIALASGIGRAYGFSVALILLLGAIAVVGKGWMWAFAHILPLWLSVFLGCLIGVAIVRGARRLFASRA